MGESPGSCLGCVVRQPGVCGHVHGICPMLGKDGAGFGNLGFIPRSQGSFNR